MKFLVLMLLISSGVWAMDSDNGGPIPKDRYYNMCLAKPCNDCIGNPRDCYFSGAQINPCPCAYQAIIHRWRCDGNLEAKCGAWASQQEANLKEKKRRRDPTRYVPPGSRPPSE